MGKVFTPQYSKPTPNPDLIISRDFSLLHPIFRTSAAELIRHLNEEGIPFGLFEGFRSPSRQQYLFDSGRKRPGNVVTKAKAWESYHQYGLAGDFVPIIGGEWKWGGPDVEPTWWNRLHEVGQEYGLEPLSWEQPHLQLSGFTIRDLISEKLPGGGDESWFKNLASWREKFPCRA